MGKIVYIRWGKLYVLYGENYICYMGKIIYIIWEKLYILYGENYIIIWGKLYILYGQNYMYYMGKSKEKGSIETDILID